MSVFIDPGSKDTIVTPSGTSLATDFVSPSIPNFDVQYGVTYMNKALLLTQQHCLQKVIFGKCSCCEINKVMN